MAGACDSTTRRPPGIQGTPGEATDLKEERPPGQDGLAQEPPARVGYRLEQVKAGKTTTVIPTNLFLFFSAK
jgi:hypothetical protein